MPPPPQDFSPESVPLEWHRWAKGHVSAPPTREAIALSEAQRAYTVRKAKELDEEFARLQAKADAKEPPKLDAVWDPNKPFDEFHEKF